MKKKNLTFWTFMLSLTALVVVSSCGDDEEQIPVPVADFSSSIDGKTVTFTDASTDATSYAWDFGDGNTSTDASTSHTYEANGSYVAKLTVTNESGEDSKQEVLEIINIVIDGDFSEWADVPAITDAEGTLTMMKVENLGNTKLFVYIEGTDEITPKVQMMLNIDGDTTTGALIDWLWPNSGEDVYFEGDLPVSETQGGGIYNCSPCDGSSPGNWNWDFDTPVNAVIADFIVASSIETVAGGKAYEFSLDLTALGGTVDSEVIGIGFLDIDPETWGPAGAIPKTYDENDNPNAKIYDYTFK